MRFPLGLSLAASLVLWPGSATAAGVPTDVALVEAHISSNFLLATVKNVSSHQIDSLKMYFYVFDKNGKYTETVEADFVGRIRAGDTAQIRGGVFKSFQPGPPIINAHAVEFFQP